MASHTVDSSRTSPASDSARTITILYFAAALTATRIPSETIDLPFPAGSAEAAFPLNALGELLARRHAGTNLDEILKTSRWSVDAEMVDDLEDVMLKGGEEVAIICPVSGG